MEKLLCPTDFSDTATNAIAYAAKLAQATGCSLTLLNVQSLWENAPANLIQGRNVTLELASRQLEEQSIEITKVFKINCDVKVQETATRLSSVIKEVAHSFDLIVMGSNGPDDLYQFFSGSNAYNAIANSEVPVLLIPENYGYSKIDSLVFAFDYFRTRNIPVNKLLPVIKALNCELRILQVMEESFSKEADDYLKDLQNIFRSVYSSDIKLTFETIHAADVPQAINNYIIKNSPDGLVLWSEHRGFLSKIFHRSVIKHISAICSYPVLVFHK